MKGECIRAEVCHNTGAALSTETLYLTSKNLLPGYKNPTLMFFEDGGSGVYTGPKPIQLMELITFRILK